MKGQYFVIYALSVLLACGCAKTNEKVAAVNLRTEYLTEPIGIGVTNPRFTWEYSGDDKKFSPARTEIHIGTSPDNLSLYTKDFKFQPFTKYYWNVAVWDKKGRECKKSKTASFETAQLQSSDWTAQWISDNHDKNFEPAPLFRRRFNVNKNIIQARAYVTATGYYELFINGEKVSENRLDPGYTAFDKRMLFVTHDITHLLKQGENVAAAVLGNGWFNVQAEAVWDFHKVGWRERPKMLCELHLKYNDGTTEKIVTNGSWLTSTGPYIYNNIYSGDYYDARLEKNGWNNIGYNDDGWSAAVIKNAPAPIILAQQMPAIKITEEVKPSEMKKFNDRLYLFSFPKNFAGVCQLSVKGEAGTRITLKHGELLKDNGRLEMRNIDIYYHPSNPEKVFQTDAFTLKGTGDYEIFMPSFTYHGFQYVEVESSKPIKLTKESLTGYFMHTDLDRTGTFSCSNELLNKIWNASIEAYRSNIYGLPTDCPQREKNGWTNDAQVMVDFGLLAFDGITVYEKWMNDFIDNQKETGEISGIIPSSGWGYIEGFGPEASGALFIIPNAIYDYYGDSSCIEKMYPSMLRHLNYLKSKETDQGLIPNGLGDWSKWNATTGSEYVASLYYYKMYDLMARFSALLDKDAEPYKKKAEEIKSTINNKYFNTQENSYETGTQAANALALFMGIVPEGKEQTVADKLHETVAANDYFLDFGMYGSKSVPRMLSKYGYTDDVIKMATKTDAPSWGYWLGKMGYSTLAETWTLSPQFNDASLNHIFKGDISAWMMNTLAGINYDPSAPGFENIVITPQFPTELDWAKGEYKSVKGIIRSEWKRNGNGIELTVTIPTGCKAHVNAGKISENIGSGTYTFKL